MIERITLIVVGISGLVVTLVLVAAAATELRDDLVNRGWISENSKLGGMSVRAQHEKVWRVLQQIGFKPHHFEGVAFVGDRESARRRLGGTDLARRPDEYLIRAIKPWTRELSPPYSFEGTGRFYVDTMGAIHSPRTYGPSLVEIMDAWLSHLQRLEMVPSFDCVLTSKDGNPFLARYLCERLYGSSSGRAIVCKGTEDPSRVKRESWAHVHITDFEGLEVLGQENESVTANRKLRAIALDDNCTTGGSMCSAIRRFNEFVLDPSNSQRYPVEPIKSAVVLFVVKSDVTRQNFAAVGVRLHALLSLGEKEMEQIRSEPVEKLIRDIRLFKVDDLACQASNLLHLNGGGGVPF